MMPTGRMLTRERTARALAVVLLVTFGIVAVSLLGPLGSGTGDTAAGSRAGGEPLVGGSGGTASTSDGSMTAAPVSRVLAGSARRPLPAPVFTQTPPDPSPSPESMFAWTHPQVVTFRCAVDQGPWFACASPLTLTVAVDANEEHRFRVRALDGGLQSEPAVHRWKITKFDFSIEGGVYRLVPGVWQPISLTLSNPNNFTIFVISLRVTASSSPATCPAATNIEFLPSPVSESNTIAVPAHGSTVVTGVSRPQIRLMNLPTNQDACKGLEFGLAYTGLAVK